MQGASNPYAFRRAQEQAEKRFQVLTKETDWRIAKAYVALALDPDIVDEDGCSKKEGSTQKIGASPECRVQGYSTEARAINKYMNDDQWEVAQRAAGYSVEIPGFPPFSHS